VGILVTIKEAIPMDEYLLEITMSNGNYLTFNMSPYIDTVQYCPIKDIKVWKNVQVFDSYLLWDGSARVELSIDTILDYFA